MSIVLTEPGKRLEFDIIGYEFSDTVSEESGFDANWLLFGFTYTVFPSETDPGAENKAGQTFVYEDASMLTWELKALYEDIGGLLDGSRDTLATDFTEPYLSIELGAAGDRFGIKVRFVYDTEKEWKELSVGQYLTRQELSDLAEELKEMYRRFPQR